MSQIFIIGSVVRLKSGGPNMTITSSQSGVVTCTYFSPNDELKTLTTPERALCLIEEQPESTDN